MLAPGPHVVGKIVTKESQYGNYIYEITFISNMGEITHTYVDPDNRNYKKWQEIIDLFDQGWGIILDDLRYKLKDNQRVFKSRTQEPLVNADSRIKVLYKTKNRQEVIDQLYEVLN